MGAVARGRRGVVASPKYGQREPFEPEGRGALQEWQYVFAKGQTIAG